MLEVQVKRTGQCHLSGPVHSVYIHFSWIINCESCWARPIVVACCCLCFIYVHLTHACMYTHAHTHASVQTLHSAPIHPSGQFPSLS